ncbi:MAG: M3 family metallopeptidase, partial [Usitatibacter sp.]
MKRRILAVLAALACCAAAAERPEDRWNLSDLYPNVTAWDADAARIGAQLGQFADCRGRLGESAKRFRECLDLEYDFLKRLGRLSVYSGELLAEDTGAPASLDLNQKAQVLGAKIAEATSFVNPEILAMGKAKIAAFVAKDPALNAYRQPIDDILRNAPHTLDRKGEAIMAGFALSAGAAGSIYQIFANAEVPWPTVKLSDGKEVRLDPAAYTQHREARDRGDRKKVFDAFFGTWKEFERTFGVTFYENLKEDTVYAKLRKYPDSMTRALDANTLPPAVLEALVKSANANLPTLHRYFRLRAKMLGLREMRYYDI